MSDALDRRILLKALALASLTPESSASSVQSGTNPSRPQPAEPAAARMAANRPADFCPPAGQGPGEQPFPDGPEWTQLRSHLQELFGKASLSGSLPREMQSLHAILAERTGFPNIDAEQYRYLQAELLLNQAADLLDRGIRDRTEWEELAVKRFMLGVELLEFDKLDQIHADEIINGVYTLAAKQSKAELDAERKSREIATAVQGQLTSVEGTYYSASQMDRQKTANKQAVYAPLVPGYNKEYSNISADRERDYYPFEDWVTGQHNVSKADLAIHASNAQTDFNLGVAKGLLRSQILGAGSAAETEQLREPGLAAKACWDEKDTGFKRARTQTARDLQKLKVKAAVDPGGALNYTERMLPIIQRAQLDFDEAKAKLAAGAKGMRLLYGYDDPLPQHEALGLAFFDACLLWVRRAINFMVRFRQLEQNSVLPISVKAQAQAGWAAGLATGKWEFDVPASLFSSMSHVRLRGLSICVIVNQKDDDRASLFQGTVLAPRCGKSIHRSGHSEDLDQSGVPTCHAGRVAARGSIREPDVVGTSALYNASPIGCWQVELRTQSTTGLSIQKVKDVMLDLHLAYRALPTVNAPISASCPCPQNPGGHSDSDH